MTQTKLRCLIVGAGSSGLAAAREALKVNIEPVVYEARQGSGGAWRFDPDPGQCTVTFNRDGWATFANPQESDHAGPWPPSPMYDGLRTNVPTTLMQYRASPFDPTVPLFASHEQVQSYLVEHAKPLLPYLHFEHRVDRIRYTVPSDRGEQRKWYAEISSIGPADGGSRTITDQFDFIMVANGHYSKPFVPWIEGLDTWSGELSHARWYRNPKRFELKSVLVVGNSASGYDITRELATAIHERRKRNETPSELPQIMQSARSPSALGIAFDSPDAPDWAQEIRVFPPIGKIEGKKIYFEDGTALTNIDTIIFATGYYFSFPFLHSSDAPWNSHPIIRRPTISSRLDSDSDRDRRSTTSQTPVNGGLRLHNLDDRCLFYLPDPTAVFLCLPYLVIPFPLAQIQSRLAVLHFTNDPQLPRRPLEFKPPQPRVDAQEGEGEPELSRQSVVWGHPKNYDMMDRMMEESGDIRRSNVDDDDDDETERGQGPGEEEEGREGREEEEEGGLRRRRSTTTNEYGKTSQGERDLRLGAKALRRAVLGY